MIERMESDSRRTISVRTVEKMQGEGAAAVIYSLASSSKDSIAGQTERLLTANRWNVALSRALSRAIVVGAINAHLTAVRKSLDGIAAQDKNSWLLQDEKRNFLTQTSNDQ